MAKITVGGFVKTRGLSFEDFLSEELDDIMDYDTEKFTKTGILLKDDAKNYMQFTGTNLTYKFVNGEIYGITGGTLTSFKIVADGLTIINETGLSLSAKTLNAAIDSGSSAKFLAALLSGSDTITGTAYADMIWGDKGNDTLYGGKGNDDLDGDSGNDVVYGQDGNDWLDGGTGNDTLNGGTGNDFLRAQAGNDKLTGGTGKDTFIFDTALSATTNIDTITDFNVKDDTIHLENGVFTKLTKAGPLASSAFYASTSGKAHDANDRIIYETDTGKLFYDSNGSASGGSVHFATLSKNLSLTYADFIVI
jgi:Ca2+-binding RTX toxin-like protein